MQLSLKHRSYALSPPPPPLCVLTSLIAVGRRGAEPVSPFFLSFPSILSSLHPFRSRCLLPLMTNLAVSSSCCVRLWKRCMWLSDTQRFPPWKTSLPVQWVLYERRPISDQWQCLTQIEGFVFRDEGEGIVLCLLHCLQWFLSETLCAEALGVTQCSLHQSSNEAVATLAPVPIEPRTNSLPGGSVFQSTGPPSRLPPFSTRTHPPPPIRPL